MSFLFLPAGSYRTVYTFNEVKRCIQLGYMFMLWALSVQSWYDAFKISGSSLLALGFALVDTLPTTILIFSEATIGLILVALLIAFCRLSMLRFHIVRRQ